MHRESLDSWWQQAPVLAARDRLETRELAGERDDVYFVDHPALYALLDVIARGFPIEVVEPAEVVPPVDLRR